MSAEIILANLVQEGIKNNGRCNSVQLDTVLGILLPETIIVDQPEQQKKSRRERRREKQELRNSPVRPGRDMELYRFDSCLAGVIFPQTDHENWEEQWGHLTRAEIDHHRMGGDWV